MQMNKRGISHIEIMLSFLIFMGFVLFSLYFFSPFKTGRLVESSLTYAFREIKNDALVEIETYSVVLNLQSPPPEGVIAVKLENALDNVNVRAENYLEEVIPSKRDGSNQDIIYIDFANAGYGLGKGFASIKLSSDFEPYIGSVAERAVDGALYKIASSNSDSVISEKKIIELKNKYDSDYEALKKDFNLPNKVNFGFGIVYSNDKIEASKEVPKNLEIFSNNERIKVLKANGKIEFADLIVKIW